MSGPIHNHIKAFVQKKLQEANIQNKPESQEVKIDVWRLSEKFNLIKKENEKLKMENAHLRQQVEEVAKSIGAVIPNQKQSSMEEMFKKRYSCHEEFYKNWILFGKFCMEENRNMEPASVHPFIKSLAKKEKASMTLKRVRNQVHRCLDLLGMKETPESIGGLGRAKKKKYVVKKEEVEPHLEHLKGKGEKEMATFQRTLHETGSRFRAVKSMRVKDIYKGYIIPQETKTEKREIRISDKLQQEIEELIEERKVSGDELVFSYVIYEVAVARSLERSPVLTGKDPRYAYGGHCFRVAAYNDEIRKLKTEWEREAGRKLGHTNSKTGRKSYMSSEIERELKEMKF